MAFEIITPITGVVVIASGSGVRIRPHLNRSYGTSRWRKIKGFATVRFNDITTAPSATLKYTVEACRPGGRRSQGVQPCYRAAMMALTPTPSRIDPATRATKD
jgi:hypothetical protein